MIRGIWALLIVCAAALFGAPTSVSATAERPATLSSPSHDDIVRVASAYLPHAVDLRPTPRTDHLEAAALPSPTPALPTLLADAPLRLSLSQRVRVPACRPRTARTRAPPASS